MVASVDSDAVLKLGADCCISMPRATGKGQTTAGLTEDELVYDVAAMLGAGTNVISPPAAICSPGGSA